MKILLIAVASAVICTTGCSQNAESTPAESAETREAPLFDTDYDAALARAKANGKKLFVLFTGSDWCIWCKRLESEVFSQPEFISAAPKEFELVILDFPSDKSKQTDEQRAKCKALSERYSVEGFPTVKIIDPKDESVIHEAGYAKGGAVKWLKKLHDDMKYSKVVEEKLGALQKEFRELGEKFYAAMRTAQQGPVAAEGKALATKNAAMAHIAEFKALKAKIDAADIPQEIESYKKELAETVSNAIEWMNSKISADGKDDDK